MSGLEQSQNALRLSWSREEVDEKLQGVMRDIHSKCVGHGSTSQGEPVNYVKGANIAGFIKFADAMLDSSSAKVAANTGSSFGFRPTVFDLVRLMILKAAEKTIAIRPQFSLRQTLATGSQIDYRSIHVNFKQSDTHRNRQ